MYFRNCGGIKSYFFFIIENFPINSGYPFTPFTPAAFEAVPICSTGNFRVSMLAPSPNQTPMVRKDLDCSAMHLLYGHAQAELLWMPKPCVGSRLDLDHKKVTNLEHDIFTEHLS